MIFSPAIRQLISIVSLEGNTHASRSGFYELDLVEKNAVLYKCDDWQNAQWCSMSGYKPLSPTVAGGYYLDPFSKVNIQTTSDTNPNRSEVPVFSGGCRNSVSISLLLIFGFSVILIVLDYLDLVCVFSFSFQLL
jgi:hypothetical protein